MRVLISINDNEDKATAKHYKERAVSEKRPVADIMIDVLRENAKAVTTRKQEVSK